MKCKFNFKIVYTNALFLCGFVHTMHEMNNMSVMQKFEFKFSALHRYVKPILSEDDFQLFGNYMVASNCTIQQSNEEFNKKLYKWLVTAKITEKDAKIKIDQSFARDGYYFFSGDTGGFSFLFNEKYQPLKYFFIKNSGFSGVEMRIIYPNVTVGTDDLHLLTTGLVKKIKAKILSLVTSVYKVHLMPAEKCIYPVVLELIHLINNNPKITKDISFLDSISNIKVLLDTDKKRTGDEVKAVIVIYMPMIFLSEDHRSTLFSKNVKDEEKLNLLENNYTEWVDYKKAKRHTELFLKFLISYFKDKKYIEGSGITPRFNEKITDLIYVAQGHGDDKKNTEVLFLI